MKIIILTLLILLLQGCNTARSSQDDKRVFVRNSLSKLPDARGSAHHPFSDFEEVNDVPSIAYDHNWRKEVFQYGVYKISRTAVYRHRTEGYLIACAYIGFVGSHETLYSEEHPPKASASYYVSSDRKRAFVSFEELLNDRP